MHRHLLSLFLSILLITTVTTTLFPSGNNLQPREALTAVYEFRFQDADSIISQLEISHPQHYLPHILRSQYNWWFMITHPDSKALRDNYSASLEKAERYILREYDKENISDELVFNLISVYAFRARLELLNSNYTAALNLMRRSVEQINLSLKRENEYPPYLLTSGLYNYAMGYAQKRFYFLRVLRWWSYGGDTSVGLQKLKQSSISADEPVKTEATYFLMKIYLEAEKDLASALPYAEWLVARYPTNLIYLYHHYQISKGLHHNEKAMKIRENYLHQIENNKQLNEFQVVYLRGLV